MNAPQTRNVPALALICALIFHAGCDAVSPGSDEADADRRLSLYEQAAGKKSPLDAGAVPADSLILFSTDEDTTDRGGGGGGGG